MMPGATVETDAWERVGQRLAKRFLVERMSQDRVEELCAFFKRAYADQPIAAAFQDEGRILRRWRWLNEENPVPLDGGLPAWVCLKDGRIVGHFAALPALGVVGGEPVPICWGRDLIVAPQMRQSGVGPLLIMTAVRAAQRPFFIAGLNETVYPIYRRLGFVDCGTIPLYLKVDQPGRLFETMPWPRLVRRLAAVGLTVAQRLRWRRRLRTQLSCAPLAQFDQAFDRWWARIEPAFPCVVRRTSAVMAWRYHRHPEHRYRVLAVGDGQGLRGVAVVRRGRSRGLRAGFISELLAHPRDGDALESLLDHAEAFLRSSEADPPAFIRCAVLHPRAARALARSGFVHAPSPIHWMLTQAQGASALDALAQRNRWFLNSGDSDLDMLSP